MLLEGYEDVRSGVVRVDLSAGVGAQSDSLIQTKLTAPPPRSAVVARPRLLARLDAGLRGPLTLIAAPAGFGKTTLLATWLRQNEKLKIENEKSSAESDHSQFSIVNSQFNVAWLSLDAADNDPLRFWRYLLSALDLLQPGIAAPFLANIQAFQPASLRAMLHPEGTRLLNALGALPADALLVLDDYHVIDAPAIHQALTFLLDHMPPRLHLVIASRTDPPLPLARMRARHQLTEIRAADLRFGPDEAAAFLNDVMGLGLAAAEVAALEARTEGWITGLQLAALSMQRRGDRPGFIAALRGSHRSILDYLVDEVIDRQSENVRAFLMQTSILDRMCGPLCDAVLLRRTENQEPRTDPDKSGSRFSVPDSQLILEKLERANLFVVPLDEERRWYRYHQLFAEALAHRLEQTQPESAAIVHGRASAWYEAQGMPDDAIRHALAARDVARAARLLDQHAQTAIMRGEAATLLRWLDAIPGDQVRVSPRLCIAAGWAHFIALNAGGRMERIEPALQDAERALAELSDLSSLERDQLLAEVHGLRATIAIEQGDTARGIVLAQAALDRLGPSNLFLRGSLSYSLGDTYRAHGDTRAAIQAFTDARALGETSGSLVTALLTALDLTEVLIEHGQLRLAAATCQEALSLAERLAGYGDQAVPLAGAVKIGLAKILYEWDELHKARTLLEAGIKLARQPGGLGIARHGVLALAFVEQALGQIDHARALAEEAEQLARASPRGDALPRLWPAKVRLWLAQGNLSAARAWADKCGYDPDRPPPYPEELTYGGLARVYLAQPTAAALRKAGVLVSSALAVAEARGRSGHVIDLLLLQALILRAQGKIEPALASLARSLALAEPEGYVRTFVDAGAALVPLLRSSRARGIAPAYVTRLLNALELKIENEKLKKAPDRFEDPHFQFSILNSQFEALTPRELEVLHLLAAGLSNAEIAERLIITVGTTKRHVLHIYGKLEVRSRAQAIVRARELGLVE
jgi:LuxR family maltose regulon positive regulatory protein